MSVIRRRFKVDGVLTDMTSVKLSSEDGTYGVKRNDTGAVVVADGTAMTHVSTGIYDYTFTDPADDLTYTYSVEWVYGGETYWFEATLAGPVSTGIITVAEAQTRLRITGSDDMLAHLIISATDLFEAKAGRSIISTSNTEILDGNGTEDVWLTEPAESITTVHEDSARAWAAASLVAAADYKVHGCRLHKYAGCWLDDDDCLRVAYNAGFASIPKPLKEACYMQVAFMYQQWQLEKKGLNVVTDERIEQWSQAFVDRGALAPGVKEILDEYAPFRL